MPRKALWVGIYPPKRHPKLRKRLRPVSKRRQAVAAEYAHLKRVWKAVLVKNGQWYCKKCGGEPEDTPHHYRGRAGKLLCDTKFWVVLCAQCHSWVHQHPDLARYSGLLCAQGYWNRQP